MSPLGGRNQSKTLDHALHPLAASLAKAQPDVVAVETHPGWFAVGRYRAVTYEAEGVAVPWATARGLSSYGVDWKDIIDWDRGEELNALLSAARAETGRLEESAALLDGLIIEHHANVELYPFPERWWRMRYDLHEAASLERARLWMATDTEHAIEGERCLLVTVEEPNPIGYGFHLRQECSLPTEGAPDTLEITMSLRSEGVERLQLAIRNYLAGSNEPPLAEAMLDPTLDDWQTARIRFAPPSNGQFQCSVQWEAPPAAMFGSTTARP